MKRITVIFLFLVVVVMSCNKVSPVPLTAAQQLQHDIAVIDQYLADNHIDAIKLESGLRVVIHQEGNGQAPAKDNCVRIHYTGIGLFKTTAFTADSDLKLPYKGLIAGMQIGLKQMSVGGKATFYIPSGLGYGAPGQYDNVLAAYVIDPNENLRFEVELVQLYQYNVLANYCYE